MSEASEKGLRSNSLGRAGGPATIAGIQYQIRYAALQALHLILDAVLAPLDRSEISIEPRTTVGDVVTDWDIASRAPVNYASGVRGDYVVRRIEAKLEPKHEDVVTWLDRVMTLAPKYLKTNLSWFVAPGQLLFSDSCGSLCARRIRSRMTCPSFPNFRHENSTAGIAATRIVNMQAQFSALVPIRCGCSCDFVSECSLMIRWRKNSPEQRAC